VRAGAPWESGARYRGVVVGGSTFMLGTSVTVMLRVGRPVRSTGVEEFCLFSLSATSTGCEGEQEGGGRMCCTADLMYS
jgi:hypothetical protein